MGECHDVSDVCEYTDSCAQRGMVWLKRGDSPGCECAGWCGVRMDFSDPPEGTGTFPAVASGTLLASD